MIPCESRFESNTGVARVRAAAQGRGRVARRLIEGFLGRALRVPDSLLIGPDRCVDGRQQLPAARFCARERGHRSRTLGAPRSSGGYHAILRQSRDGRALSRPRRNLTIDRGEIYRARGQAGPGNDINVGSSGSQKAPTWSPASLACHPGKRQPRPLRDDPFGSAFAMAQAVAHVRWRRCFARSLALRLLARIVLLDLAVFFTRGSDLDGVGAVLADIRHQGHCVSGGSGTPSDGCQCRRSCHRTARRRLPRRREVPLRPANVPSQAPQYVPLPGQSRRIR
jgi:hypothetical protein